MTRIQLRIGKSKIPVQRCGERVPCFQLRSRIVPRRLGPTCLLLLLAGMISAAASAEDHYAIDPAQSAVHFSLGDTLHQFGGVFHITSGEISFDRRTGQMSGKIVVDAASGDSGSAARDKKMKKDELKVQAFPSVIFEPGSFTGTLADSGTSQIQVQGVFTLVGKPHPLTVPMTVQVDGSQCTATGSFTVPYVEWGLKDPSMFLVKMQKEVKIDLTLKGQIARGQ